MLGAAPATIPNTLRPLSPECASTRWRKVREGGDARQTDSACGSQSLGTRAGASLGLPAPFRPCCIHSCLHFFRVMNTLPDNRHFWKSLVSSVRNWNTRSPAPLGNSKPPPPRPPPRQVPVPPAEGDRGPELSPKQYRSLSRPALAIPAHSPAAPSRPCCLRSASISPKPLEPEVSPGLGGTSAIRFQLSSTQSLLPPSARPPRPAPRLRSGAPPPVPGRQRPRGSGAVRDFTDKQIL